jgi:hypothetical protein
MHSTTRASAILIVCVLLSVVAQSATAASDGGWILWEKTTYFGQEPAELVRQGFSDRWSVVDGYDTAADCHAASRVKAESLDKTTNEFSAKLKPVGFVNINRCFPVGFDPRKMT